MHRLHYKRSKTWMIKSRNLSSRRRFGSKIGFWLNSQNPIGLIRTHHIAGQDCTFNTSTGFFIGIILLILKPNLAINRTPNFGVWSTLATALNFGGVWITAPTLKPALHLLLKKPNISNFVKNIFKKYFFTIFFIS